MGAVRGKVLPSQRRIAAFCINGAKREVLATLRRHAMRRGPMKHKPSFAVLPLLAAIGLLGACAGGSDRYPSLSLRDFERVQGSYAAPDSAAAVLRPAPLGVTQVEEIGKALEEASARHTRFLAHAETARPIVADAAGTGPEDKRWGLAQVEIAELDSRRAGTAALLADLDQLYADTSLSFTERDQVAQANAQLEGIVAAEDRVIGELIDLLAKAPN